MKSWERDLPKRLVKKVYAFMFIASINAIILLGATANILVFHEQHFWASGLLLLSFFPIYALANATVFFITEWEDSIEEWKRNA